MALEVLSHPDKKLIDHLNGVEKKSLKKFDRISQYIDWKEVFGYERGEIRKALSIASKWHDIGKATVHFQKKIRGERANSKLSRHALLSALYTFDLLQKAGLDEYLSFIGYLIVKAHHAALKDLNEYDYYEEEEFLKKQIKQIIPEFFTFYGIDTDIDISKVYKKIRRIQLLWEESYGNKTSHYFLIKLLFSILTSSDREDVVLGAEDFPLDTSEVSQEKLDKFMERFTYDTYINKIRKEFHEEVRNFPCSGENIFAISAPTGIGKTLANIRLALKLKEHDGIIVYALPLINIIEQTAEISKKIFGGKNILEYHHLSEISIDEETNYGDYLKSLQYEDLKRKTFNYPFIVTTFVSFFEPLIGSSKAIFLHRLVGGVVILDEIQTLPYEKWKITKEVIEFLPKIGVEVIYSTATKPTIFKATEVVKTNYFKHFNRTKIEVKEKLPLDEFSEKIANLIKDGKRTLIIMNTVKSAEKLYENLSLQYDSICYLSSKVLPVHRKERVKKIKNGDYKICVSTQVIEAGIDVSFERVVRDIAPLDSIIQAAGRCNRNSEKGTSKVLVYSIEEEGQLLSKYIYGKLAVDHAQKILGKFPEIEEKNYHHVVNEYFKNISNYANIDKGGYTEKLKKLFFSQLSSFRIIENQSSISFLLLINEEIEEKFNKLLEEANALEKSDIDRYKKSLLISIKLKEFSPYIVSTIIREDEIAEMGAFETRFGLVVIRKESIENFYHPVFGLHFQKPQGVFV